MLQVLLLTVSSVFCRLAVLQPSAFPSTQLQNLVGFANNGGAVEK